MKIINFEEAKTRIRSKEKEDNYLTGIDNGVRELEKQYRELVEFYERWYDEHVVGQDENGGWIYRD